MALRDQRHHRSEKTPSPIWAIRPDLAIESVGQIEDDSTLTDFNPSDLSARGDGRPPRDAPTPPPPFGPADGSTSRTPLVERIQDFGSTNAPVSTVKELRQTGRGAPRRHTATRPIKRQHPRLLPRLHFTEPDFSKCWPPTSPSGSDSFVIHAVGTSANSAGGNLVSTARCEVSVQRLPDGSTATQAAISEVWRRATTIPSGASSASSAQFGQTTKL